MEALPEWKALGILGSVLAGLALAVFAKNSDFAERIGELKLYAFQKIKLRLAFAFAREL